MKTKNGSNPTMFRKGLALLINAFAGDDDEQEVGMKNRESVIQQLSENSSVQLLGLDEGLEDRSDEELRTMAEMAGIDCNECGDDLNANSGDDDEDDDDFSANNYGDEEEYDDDDKKRKKGKMKNNSGITAEDLALLREFRQNEGAIRDMIANAKATATTAATKKGALVKKLAKGNILSLNEDELSALSLPVLMRLSAVEDSDYSGMGAGGRSFLGLNAEDEKIPAPPAILLANAEGNSLFDDEDKEAN